jgi:DNA-binding NarL/FixJ family response regulator
MFSTLLVEDSVVFRHTMVDLLRQHFPLIDVTEAFNGEDAFLKIEQIPPDLIFMDIQLPKENGLELTRKIKQLYNNIEIVILSSNNHSEYRQQAFRNGADCFLCKGDDACFQEILARVEGALARKSYH